MAKQRSPNYPAMSLRDAVEAVRQIYDKEKKTSVSGEVIAKDLGYSGLSGPSRVKIAALKKYGLVDGDERKGLRVSDLSVRILYPSNADDQVSSLQEAALKPELFQTLYDSFRDGSDEAMRSHLINRMDFAPMGARQVIASFRDTYAFAGLNQKAYTDFDTSDKSEAEDMREHTGPSLTGTQSPQVGVVRSLQASAYEETSNAQNTWTWTLSMPRAVRADLRIVGTPTKADIARLKKQIDALEESFDEE
jgi:biotin operon repressor